MKVCIASSNDAGQPTPIGDSEETIDAPSPLSYSCRTNSIDSNLDQPSTSRFRLEGILLLIVVSFLMVIARSSYTIFSQAFKTTLLPGCDSISQKNDIANIAIFLVGCLIQFAYRQTRELRVPIFITLLESWSVLLVVPGWLLMQWFRTGTIFVRPNRFRIRTYIICAFFDSINTVFGSIGLSLLPPVVYTILKTMTILLSVLFSRMLTYKQFNWYHYCGVCGLFASVIIASASASSGTGSTTLAGRDIIFGVISCFVSSLCLALVGVLTYKLFVKEGKGDILLAVETSVMQSFFVAIMTLPLLFCPEVSTWSHTYQMIKESGTTPIFYALSTGILLSRPLTLFSVTAVTCCSSPVVVQALGGPRRCFLIVLCIIIFKEPVPIQKVISIVGMCISLGMYAYGGHILRQKKRVFSDPQSDKCPV